MTGGTYTLVVEVPERSTETVGALGAVTFEPGWYAYTGSDRSAEGFQRVERHREVADGGRTTRHWHVDYLLGATGTSVDAVVRSPGADVECAVAERIDGAAVPDFGCSDCACDSHLAFSPFREPLLAAVDRAHREARG